MMRANGRPVSWMVVFWLLLSTAAVSTVSAQTTSRSVNDSVVNGALIGAGAAVASGLFLCTRTEPWRNCRDDAGPILRIAAIGAAVGAGVDALFRRREPLLSTELGATGRDTAHRPPRRRIAGLAALLIGAPTGRPSA
jgi:hypothetical protein